MQTFNIKGQYKSALTESKITDKGHFCFCVFRIHLFGRLKNFIPVISQNSLLKKIHFEKYCNYLLVMYYIIRFEWNDGPWHSKDQITLFMKSH